MRLIDKNRTWTQLLWLCLVIAFICGTYILFQEYRFAFNSDGAIETVLARLTFYEGRLIPHDWIYANGDLFLVSPKIFQIIIFPWLGISFLSNAAAVWIGYLYLLLVTYGACRVVAPERRRAAIVATTLAAGCLSPLSFNFVIAQGAYSMFVALTLILFAFAARPYKPVPCKHGALTLVLVATAAGLVCASNATRGVITIVLPLLSGWAIVALLYPDPDLRSRLQRLRNPVIVVIILGAALGTALYRYWLLPSVLDYEAVARVGLASKAEMWQHLKMLPGAWFGYLSISPGAPWQTLSPLLRVLQAFNWAISVALLVGPSWVVVTPRRHAKSLLTLSWFTLASYGIVIAALTAAPSLFINLDSMRYATFGIFLSICVLAILVDGWSDHHPAIAITILVIVSLISVSTISALRSSWSRDTKAYGNSMALIGALEKHGVGTILATYWHSHVLTVLSNGDVEAYPLLLGAPLQPYVHHQPRKIFYGSAGRKQAVVLSDDEASPPMIAAIECELGTPEQKFKSGVFSVWVYDRDITKPVYGSALTAPAIAAYKLQRQRQWSKCAQIASAVSRLPPPFRAELRLQAAPAVTPDEKQILVKVSVTNTGLDIFGIQPLPNNVHLGAHSVDASGHIIDMDLARGQMPAIKPGATAVAAILLPVDKVLGMCAALLPVQEGVGWFDRWGTKPLIVGPFKACSGVASKVCNSADVPLPTVALKP